MSALIFIFLSLSLLNAGEIVHVACAGSTAVVMPKIKADFEGLHPDTEVQLVFSASGKLTAQIMEGAPYELFLSADTGFPAKIEAAGFGVGSPVTYARGGLVLFSRVEREFSKGFLLLLDPLVTTIAIADPKTAPYGLAARSALKKAGILGSLESRLVMGTTVNQALSIGMEAADYAFVPKALLHGLAVAPYNREGKNWIPVPDNLYKPIDHAMMLLKPSANNPSALVLFSYLQSQRAVDILTTWGYLPPSPIAGK